MEEFIPMTAKQLLDDLEARETLRQRGYITCTTCRGRGWYLCRGIEICEDCHGVGLMLPKTLSHKKI